MPKLEEAEAFFASGKKHHTRTLFNWTANWDAAATDYDLASTMFAHLGNVDRARAAYEAASHAHEKAGNYFNAARALESLATFVKDKASHLGGESSAASLASHLYVRAAKMYALDNKIDRQADALVKASRLAPKSEGKKAASMITEAIEALESTGKYHYTPDLYRALILLNVRSQQYKDVIAALRREVKAFEHLQQPQNAAKAVLEIVVITLHMGDIVLAQREFQQSQDVYGFGHSREQSAAFELIAACEQRSEEDLKAALRNQTLQFIVPDIARMAKGLKVAGGGEPKGSGKAHAEEDDLR